MKYRDFCCIAVVMLLVIITASRASRTAKSFAFSSVEINREDANRESSTILTADQWVEYQIQSNANSIRLLTNVALDSRDAPDHDLHNPRTGWRYSVDYELLDANRNLLKQATYHFRSQVHQLIDVESGESIYPIFFGRSSLVATQTRAMQLPINRDNQRASILRVRAAQADPAIQEVVARVLVRSEREDYDKRTTWNRMSTKRREGLSRFCVYDHDLLTIQERNNLLRWQWKSAPVISQFDKRYLFFIGDIDDQQVRGDQLPAGLFVDRGWLGTIPVPENSCRVRLEFHWVDLTNNVANANALIQWNGMETADRKSWHHLAHDAASELASSEIVANEIPTSEIPTSEIVVQTQGGLLQVSSDRPVVIRAFVDSNDLPEEVSATSEVEITPDPNYVRSFLSDTRAITYDVTHMDNAPTPMRVVVRYPYAPLFSNLGDVVGQTSGQEAMATQVHATWEFLRDDGSVAGEGMFPITPIPSQYDRFTVSGQREPVSDPAEFFFAVPQDVSQVRIQSSDCRLLVSAYVRPSLLRSVTAIPEDYHVYSLATSTRRSWYGINPIDHDAMVQTNRSFIVQTQSRPSEPNEEVLAGRFEWERFVPEGAWIARELLIPREIESSVRQSTIGSIYYQLDAGVAYRFADHELQIFGELTDARLIFASQDHPGHVNVLIDGKNVYQKQLLSSHGEIALGDLVLPAKGQVEIRSQNPSTFFFQGKHVDQAASFLKRSAQRLKDGQLGFQYDKTSTDDEIVTLQLFRKANDSARCRIEVDIEEYIDSGNKITDGDIIKPSWTIRRREFDLRPQAGPGSVSLGHSDRVDTGYRCFIKLGSDLPVGLYRIRVRRSDTTEDAYALLYKIVSRQRPTRMLQVNSSAGESDGN